MESSAVPQLPDVMLHDLDGQAVGIGDLGATGPLVVVFAANHCKYVSHVEDEVGRVAAEYSRRGVNFVAICSSDLEQYPEDSTTQLRYQAERAGWRFPYLLDRDKVAAAAFGAAITPDVFVFDTEGHLVYRGAIDGSGPGNQIPVDGSALRNCLDALLAGEPQPTSGLRTIGCSIW